MPDTSNWAPVTEGSSIFVFMSPHWAQNSLTIFKRPAGTTFAPRTLNSSNFFNIQ